MDTRVRASDAERESYAEKVRTAVGEGRLTINDGDERMLAVYAATYRDELPPLVADLPPDPPPARPDRPHRRAEYGPGPTWPADRGPHGRMDHWHGRVDHWHGRRGWFPAGPLFVGAVLVGIWALSGSHFFWPAIPLLVLAFIALRRMVWWRRRAHWAAADHTETRV